MTKTRDLANLANGITSASIVDGAITDTDINANAAVVSSKLAFTQSGTGAQQRTVESKLRDVVSVLDFIPQSEHAAIKAGTSTYDAAPAIQAAITAVQPGSELVIPAGGTYLLGSQITINKSLNIRLLGTIKPFAVTGSPGTPLFSITASNVSIDGGGTGTINGISATYSNWSGIAAGNPASRLNAIHVSGLNFLNIAIDNTSAYCVNFDCVDDGSMIDNVLKNCGVLSNVVGGGFGLYMQFCRRCRVTGNSLATVGSTGINDSAGVQNIISNNNLNVITLFGMKGGYAPNVALVSSNVTPTTNTFTVAASADARRKFIEGASYTIFNAAPLAPIGYISKVVDHGTYLQIYNHKNPAAAPDVGAQVQLLQTGAIYNGNTVSYTGDNGWDVNGWSNITVTNNNLNSCGSYTEVGSFGGLAAGFWFGYDPQGPYNKMQCEGLLIDGNSVANTYGSAISIMATANNVTVTGNTLTNYNRLGSADYGGIDLTRLSFYRASNHLVSGNTCVSDNGYGIYASYSIDVHIVNNLIKSALGIAVNAQQGAVVSNNHVDATSTSTTAYGILVSDANGGNPSTDIVISGNRITVAGGFAIRNTDALFTPKDIFNGNLINGSGSSTVGGWVAVSRNGGEYLGENWVNGASYFDRINSQWATGQTITFPRTVDATGNVYLVSVHSEQWVNVAIHGLYLVSRATSSTYITPIVTCGDVTVALNGSNQVTITNVSGGNRTLTAGITLLQ